MSLVVVEMRAGAMQVSIDRVSGPVNEGLADIRRLDDRPRRAIRLESGDRRVARPPPGGPSRWLHPAPGARTRHTRSTCSGGRLPANPIQVWSAKTVAAASPGPEVEQDHVPAPQRRVAPGLRLVVGLGRVGAERNDRWLVEDQAASLYLGNDLAWSADSVSCPGRLWTTAASISRATDARISAAARWSSASEALHRAAKRETSDPEGTTVAPSRRSSSTTPYGTRSR